MASAKSELEGLKTKYYEEIKGESRLTPDQQKAVDFFNRYNKENQEASQIVEKQKSVFGYIFVEIKKGGRNIIFKENIF